MKIFITGATGFVGYYITEKLAREGHHLTILYRSEGYGYNKLIKLKGQIQFVKGDINNYELLEEVLPGHDVLLHVAAVVSFNIVDKTILEKTNVTGTANLVNSAIAQGIPNFIYISSIAALGGYQDQKVFDESTEWDPKYRHHAYAISKHQAELEVWRGSIEGLNVCILSPSLVIGNWDKSHHSMQIINKIISGSFFYTNGLKGWVDARNVGDAVSIVLSKNIYNERIILNGHNESIKNVLTLGAKLEGKKSPQYELPYSVALFVSALSQIICKLLGIKNIFTPDLVRAGYSHRQFDNTKSIRLLGLEYYSLLNSIDFALRGEK